MSVQTDQDLASLGFLCGLHHVSLPVLREAVERLRLRPAARLNGVAYFDQDQQQRLLEHLRRRREQ